MNDQKMGSIFKRVLYGNAKVACPDSMDRKIVMNRNNFYWECNYVFQETQDHLHWPKVTLGGQGMENVAK